MQTYGGAKSSQKTPREGHGFSTVPAAKTPRIGDLLLREGLVTQEQLNKALQEQRHNGTRVGYNLVKLGFVKETDLTRMLARQHRSEERRVGKEGRSRWSPYH